MDVNNEGFFEPLAQEPVAWISKGGLTELIHSVYTEVYAEQDAECLNTIPLYTTPPQRTWVGLTDEEVNDITCGMIKGWVMEQLTRAVEAKLKEKNNG